MYLTPILVLLAVLSLAGCGSLLDTTRPADVRYWLEPLDSDSRQPFSGLTVDLEVSVVPGLDTERVLVLGADASLGQLGKARWADNLPDVLQSVVARSLAGQGAHVGGGLDKVATTCSLQIEIQEFFARGASASTVSAALSAGLDCDGEQIRFDLQATKAAQAEQVQVIAALQSALDEVTRELLRQLARETE